MKFKDAISKRLYELCMLYKYTPNGLAEASGIPPTTMRNIMQGKVANPSSYIIYQVCYRLNISLKEFFDSDLFKFSNLED